MQIDAFQQEKDSCTDIDLLKTQSRTLNELTKRRAIRDLVDSEITAHWSGLAKLGLKHGLERILLEKNDHFTADDRVQQEAYLWGRDWAVYSAEAIIETHKARLGAGGRTRTDTED